MSIDRFWSKVDRRSDDECWNWTGHSHQRGYGIYWHAGKNVRANRFALELVAGPAPDDKPFALHSCDNPGCCNPQHLRWGSAMDNHQDRVMRKGPLHGENNVNSTITEAIAADIYRRRLDGWTIKEIAQELELPATTVENVYTGNAWTHCLGVNGNPTLEELRAPRPRRTKRKAPNAVITDQIADDIFKRRMNGQPVGQIAADLGLPLGTVSPVFCGLAFTHRLGVDGNPTFAELRSVRSVSKQLKLTDDDVKEIRLLLEQGYVGMDIAAKYGVSRATISLIKNGKARAA